ncbi:cytochrome C oxidase subunit IV family protein [bacterium]|nr:cytochrome C oxidase subunit IV family protein [bacterium]
MEHAHKSHAKQYMVVFAALTILTVLEVFIPAWDASYAIKASSLTALALIKAFLVAYYFMHLNEESGWTKFIAAIPLSAALYAIVLMLESVYR